VSDPSRDRSGIFRSHLTPGANIGTYFLSRWLFLRLLGLVYLIAFWSIAVQITGLVGERGIMPAGQYLDWAHSMYGSSAYAALPSVFWLGAGDAALRGVAWAGAALAVLVIVGIAPWATLFLLWALYLSISVVGQDFLSFQWDALLLETGLVALLWAPTQWLPRRHEPPPSSAARWLLLFLLFKLMFLSGATKLLSGDPTWRSGTALDYHFETQPLPTWLAWYAHYLPVAAHRIMCWAAVATELLVPWLLLLPERFRRSTLFAFAALVGLQAAIAATGNYGFFNLLAVTLCVPLLDDQVWGKVLWVRRSPSTGNPRPRLRLVAAIAVVFFVPSLLSLMRELAFTRARSGPVYFPAAGDAVLGLVAPLRSFNGYGLFRVMTTERPEIALEGSRDGEHWRAYEFRYKPGDVGRRPGFVAPYHPRLDWQMWFAALDPVGNRDWLTTLARRLEAGTPEVLGLLGRNPFAEAPPRAVRMVLYQYRFSTPAERDRTGSWWTRTPVAEMGL
jgi:hypothetical protein